MYVYIYIYIYILNCAVVGAEGVCKWVCFIFLKTQHIKRYKMTNVYTSRPCKYVTVQQITQWVARGRNMKRLSLTGVIKRHKILKWGFWIQSKDSVKIISHYISSLGFRTKGKMSVGVLCNVGSRKHNRTYIEC
jgi:hypothetical protein